MTQQALGGVMDWTSLRKQTAAFLSELTLKENVLLDF